MSWIFKLQVAGVPPTTAITTLPTNHERQCPQLEVRWQKMSGGQWLLPPSCISALQNWVSTKTHCFSLWCSQPNGAQGPHAFTDFSSAVKIFTTVQPWELLYKPNTMQWCRVLVWSAEEQSSLSLLRFLFLGLLFYLILFYFFLFFFFFLT